MNEWTRLVRTVAPTEPAVSLEEAKRHLRVFHDDDDTDIEGMIAAAQGAIEGPTGIGIVLMPQTWRLSFDSFYEVVGNRRTQARRHGEIIVPLGPVTAVTSVTYRDINGADQLITGLRFDISESPLRIWPARDTAWPLVYCEPGAVKVTFECGFAELPQDLRWAVLLLVGHYYENREAITTDVKGLAEIPLGVSSILERYRVGRVA
ncbi:hypothetical protein G6L15_06815 [Agrobacterium rhizogenes]|uniref:head-tail connector protein n=1 Tax=Rhizobium rhizogenes TaxID=359 RepID=UPI0015736525|nr:head-tail connector protein [Rhizobium rhizogenes]NTG85858.1 hypothetical protein [Rhizobium rhizogenes]